jgi:phosphotriesterase-related protein
MMMKDRRHLLKQTGAAAIAAMLQPGAGLAQTADARRLPRGSAQTVLGPVDASRLGFTLAHEHVADAPGVLDRWPKEWDGRTGLVARAVDTLEPLKAAGVQTLVDLTSYDVGRDIRFLDEVSRKSGLAIIACTGQRFFPPQFPDVTMPARTVAGLADFFRKEIEQGIDGTGIKAGVIKIGIITNQPTELEEIGLRAAARASKATGAPIRTHTAAARRAGESHAVILESEGVDPSRVSFDHSDDSGDMDYFLGLVKRGYSLGMDHVHRGMMPDRPPPYEQRADCIRRLAEAGFAGRIFLSQDTEFGGALLPAQARAWRETIDPPDGMLFTTQTLIPHLRQIGVSERDIHAMTVDNPRRFFAFA